MDKAILDLIEKDPLITLNIIVMIFTYKLVALVLRSNKGDKNRKD